MRRCEGGRERREVGGIGLAERAYEAHCVQARRKEGLLGSTPHCTQQLWHLLIPATDPNHAKLSVRAAPADGANKLKLPERGRLEGVSMGQDVAP